MYLLIHLRTIDESASSTKFTFHNVSINSSSSNPWINVLLLFTFHNVSINSDDKAPGDVKEFHLHSIMYLLIPSSESDCIIILVAFTFHNVSINSVMKHKGDVAPEEFTFHNVSINSFFQLFPQVSVCHIYIP